MVVASRTARFASEACRAAIVNAGAARPEGDRDDALQSHRELDDVTQAPPETKYVRLLRLVFIRVADDRYCAAAHTGALSSAHQDFLRPRLVPGLLRTYQWDGKTIGQSSAVLS